MGSPNIERLRASYEAYNRGEYERIALQLDPDFEGYDRPELPDPRHFVGREGGLDALVRAGEEFDDYRVEPLEFREHDDHVMVVARQRGRGKASGVVVESEIVHVWTMRGGRAAELRAFSTPEDALAHLGWSRDQAPGS